MTPVVGSVPHSLKSDVAVEFDVHLEARNLKSHFCRK
jgi:hypothetical protein